MRAKRWIAVVGLAALTVPAPAGADNHGPPGAVVVTAVGSGSANLHAMTWASGNGRACIVTAMDGYYAFESPPVPWVPGTEIVVRFDTPRRPVRVRPIAFLTGDPTTGTPVYGKTDVPYELRKVEVDGKTMWEAVLSPLPSPDLYVSVAARWADETGCGVQKAAWSFRAGVLPV